jgi:hypothetical protein
MSLSTNCEICHADTELEITDDHFTVYRCKYCKHRKAHWPKGSALRPDYYEEGNTDVSESFVRALLETRQRQARNIVVEAQRLVGNKIGWLDFGAGRGVLLEQVKAANQALVVGYDNSSVATKEMQRAGILTLDQLPETDLTHIGIVSCLDVIEHFSDPLSALQKITNDYTNAQLFIVKVPRADSILFCIAKIMHKLGMKAPFRQLFQDGTWPPHFQYFSDRSLEIFTSNAGLQPLRRNFDPDFDDIFSRLGLRPNRMLAILSKAIAPIFRETTILYLARIPRHP